MSSDATGVSSADLLVEALRLEQEILGPGWYPLACGCQLSVLCHLPGPKGYMNLKGIGNRLVCDYHRSPASFLGRLAIPKTFMHWYAPDSYGPKAITREEYGEAWDEAQLMAGSASTPITSTDGRYMIFPGGAAVPRDG